MKSKRNKKIDVNESGSKFLSWLWEFSKKIVFLLSALYIIGFIYSMVVMVKYQNFEYLGTFMEQSSDVLKTCVFGYLVKAGVENISKIIKSSLPKTTESDNEDESDGIEIIDLNNDEQGLG